MERKRLRKVREQTCTCTYEARDTVEIDASVNNDLKTFYCLLVSKTESTCTKV